MEETATPSAHAGRTCEEQRTHRPSGLPNGWTAVWGPGQNKILPVEPSIVSLVVSDLPPHDPPPPPAPSSPLPYFSVHTPQSWWGICEDCCASQMRPPYGTQKKTMHLAQWGNSGGSTRPRTWGISMLASSVTHSRHTGVGKLCVWGWQGRVLSSEPSISPLTT